ncbi:hypothetical protein RHOFW510R12_00990 [Rhodanobacter sp. FW510-R12]|uniref:hypothetical protein n=1 Tax=Rhodanobacter thiooxydans TaxID=416169 RepID=UPI00090EC2DE|nr:hypothetical protein [Rhodanobacter thiooxydans]UJJ56685.1 hypothetical protein LRK53_18930 [Rhodanobacter thiooxydans]
MAIENELTTVRLRVELTDTRDLVLFEEQDRAERHYRHIHGALMDAGSRRSAAETQAQVDRAGEFVLSAADAGRATIKSLQSQIQAIREDTSRSRAETDWRVAAVADMDTIREKGQYVLGVHANAALAGRAITDAALATAWETNGLLHGTGFERLHQTAHWLHAYVRERRAVWLARLTTITGLEIRSLADADVTWESESAQRTHWVVSNLPSGWDAAIPSEEA